MITAMIGLVTVMHLWVIDCRNQHLQNSMMQMMELNYTVHQQWADQENYHAE